MPEPLGYLILDAAVFFGFIVAVIAVGIGMSRHEKDSESYFLAGRGLSWWLIGFSLIAANISTEQFVGMSGQAANYLGLAIASYEWMAAITLVVVAFLFLPAFLRAGIYTIPEFLEYRFNHAARTIMSLLMMATYVLVTIAAVIYSGAKTVDVLFKETLAVSADGPKPGAEKPDDASGAQGDEGRPGDPGASAGDASGVSHKAVDVKLWGIPINVTAAAWAIGVLAAAYVVAGGLKACAWADLLQGSALIVGGAIILVLALSALSEAKPDDLQVHPKLAAETPKPADLEGAGGSERFYQLNRGKLHMVLPAADLFVPWTALVIGLWIPNFYYWGLNQYIVQRTLGSRSLAEGQKGVVFAAGMKLIIPFIVVFPGIIAFNLYNQDMKADAYSGTNQKTLSLFEKVKHEPGKARVAFEFNDDFAVLYPDLAGQIVDFNRRAAGVAAAPEAAPDKTESKSAPAKAPDEVNGGLLKQIQKKNRDLTADQRIEVQSKLIGYEYDSAFGLLIKKLVKPGLRGFVLAAILGAVISSLAAMLNAASTIFTMDLYRQYLHPAASQGNLVAVGRICVGVFTVIGCLIAPLLGNPVFGGIFTYIQEFQGFISPGILGVFIFGLFVKRAPRACGVAGLVLSPVVYGILKLVAPDMAFLDRMAITFFGVLVALGALTLARPLREPVRMPVQDKIGLESSRGALVWGIVVVAATLALYAVFW